MQILVAYQRAWSSQKSIHQNKDDRKKFLRTLASAMRSISTRDTLRFQCSTPCCPLGIGTFPNLHLDLPLTA